MENNIDSKIVLLVDIGGTNSRLAIVKIEANGDYVYLQKMKRETTNNFDSFEQLYKIHYKENTYKPSLAIIAVCGPIYENKVNMTSVRWGIDAEKISKNLEIPEIMLINDLEAISTGLLVLKKQNSSDLILLNDSTAKKFDPQNPNNNKPMSILVPGTGFGSGMLFPINENEYKAWPSEAGHSGHGCSGDEQIRFNLFIREKYHLNHVWVEKMICGNAINDIYEFILKDKGREINERKNEDNSIINKNSKPIEIFSCAIKENNFICTETLRLFIDIMATEASNTAIRLLPYDGIYLAGGIIFSLVDYINKTKEEIFLKSYYRVGPILKKIIQKIPVYIVNNDEELGITGCLDIAKNYLKKKVKIIQ